MHTIGRLLIGMSLLVLFDGFEPGTASTVRVIAPLDRCQETTLDGSRPGGR
jgi:hypothetical protein